MRSDRKREESICNFHIDCLILFDKLRRESVFTAVGVSSFIDYNEESMRVTKTRG